MAASAADINYPLLQENALQSSFLQLIPTRAQKGLATFDVELTCVDADGHYIAVGSNIGIVYLWDRIRCRLTKLRNDHKDSVTCVKVLISLECLVVLGCRDGAVIVFKVPFAEDEELEKFTVEGLHNAAVTSLEWAKNGMKFYSGDENGVIVCTEIDHFDHESRSRIILDEKNKIVQLSYSRLFLVVSTMFRSIVYACEENSIRKIGQKERKCYGPFGAIICHPSSPTEEVIFAARPGQRLWKSDKSGTIHETMIFKNVLSEKHYTIPLEDEMELADWSNFQFSQLEWFMNRYLLIASDFALLVIDPDLKSIVAMSSKLDPLLSMCVANDEIFVLRGFRDLMRISANTDPYKSDKVLEEPSLIEEILVPFKELSTFVKERSDSFVIQTENSNIFGWLKKNRSASTPIPLPYHKIDEIETETKQMGLPDVVKLDPVDCLPILLEQTANEDTSDVKFSVEIPHIDITKPLAEGEFDDIVYKPKRKRKNKDKKVHFGSTNPSREGNGDTKLDSKESSPESHNDNLPNGSIVTSSETDSKSGVHEVSDDTEDKKEKNIDSDTENSNSSPLVGDTLQILDNISDSSSITDSDVNSNVEVIIDSEQDNLNRNEAEDNETHSLAQEQPVIAFESESEKRADNDDIYFFNSRNENKIDPKPSLPEEPYSESTSTNSENEPPKYGTEWVEFKAPEVLLDVCVSNEHIFAVDIKNQLYYSPFPGMGLQWKKLSQPAEEIAVSPTESVVWVLYKGTLYTAMQDPVSKWKDAHWVSIARDILSISVDDDQGWYVTSFGQLITQTNLTPLQSYSYPETVYCKHHFSQVTSRDGVIWVLTTGGLLYGLDSKKRKKPQPNWKKIGVGGISEIDSIHLGVKQTGWVTDVNGFIQFIIGITPASPEGIGKPWEVEASKYFVRESSQLPKVVLKALNNEALSSLIKGKQHLSLSSSSFGVWFCKTMDQVVYSNQKCIIGHMWEQIIPSGTASTTKWQNLSAAGVNNSKGSVWCLNTTGELYCLYLSSNTPVGVEIPNCSGIQSIVPTKHSLWLLSKCGSIFFRRGITSTCLEGVKWQLMDSTQMSSEKITFLCCSAEVSWACTFEGRVFFRLGSLCPTSQRSLPQAWIPVDVEVENGESPLVDKVYVGPLGYPVWAVSNRGSVFVREDVTSSLPIGTKWVAIPELQAKSLCISCQTVWLLDYYGKIFRRFGVTERNPFGDYWKQIPGSVEYLSVTEDDDLWGLKDDNIYLHSSFALSFTSKNAAMEHPVRSISEEDWEDIMEYDM